MQNIIIEQLNKIARKDDRGRSFWSSRDLYKVLGYSSYQKFCKRIDRIINQFEESECKESDLFILKDEMVSIGSGAHRQLKAYYLTIKGCCLILEYANSSKSEIIIARRYFNEKKDSIKLDLPNIISSSDKETIRETNKAYWEKITKSTSQVYINRMGRLDKRIKDSDIKLDGFYRDDSFLGNPAPRHIIYKLGKPLVSNDGKRAYEFLIEYNIYKPCTGIYYGCRGLTIEGDHDYNINKFNDEWSTMRSKMAMVLSNIFIDKKFDLRFKSTDNANDNTYWPFWIALYEEEDIIEVAVRALKLIKDIYISELAIDENNIYNLPILGVTVDNNTMVDKRNILEDSINYVKTETAFTNEAYDKLVVKTCGKLSIDDTLKYLHNQRIIGNKEEIYEKAWKLQEDMSIADFSIMIKSIFHDKGVKCPWKYIERVILRSDGLAMRDILSQSHNEASHHKQERRKKK